jgi:glycine/D-amino acid oxidase-like deaminating enzyme
MGGKQSRQAPFDYSATPGMKRSLKVEVEEDTDGGTPRRRMLEKYQHMVHALPHEFTPTAAVIGSGLVGLLAARELALRGFDVTVIEQARTLAPGNSRYAHGTFSRHHPTIMVPWIVSVSRQWLGGFRTTSEFVSTDLSISRCIDMPTWRWMYSRWRARLPDSLVVEEAMTSLKARNVEVMNTLIEDHPELKATVLNQHDTERDVKYITQVTDDTDVHKTQATTIRVSDRITTVDPASFIDTFARLLHDEYGVNFVTEHKVTYLQYKLAFNEEKVDHAILKFEPVDEADKRETTVEGRKFDLFVVAAGPDTLNMTWKPYPVPVVDTGGYAMDIPASHPLAASFKTPVGIVGPHKLIRWSQIRDPTGLTNDLWWRVSGLISPRKHSDNPPSATWAYNALLKQAETHSSRADAEGSIAVPPGDWHSADSLKGVVTHFYRRGYSADGLPVVSPIGNCFNAFVIAGFGDDVFSLGAGAADLLGRMIVKDAPSGPANIFSHWRFHTVKPMDKQEEDDLNWQDNLLASERRWSKISTFSAEPLVRLFYNVVGWQWTMIPDDEVGVPRHELRVRRKEERKRQAAEAAAAEATPGDHRDA